MQTDQAAQPTAPSSRPTLRTARHAVQVMLEPGRYERLLEVAKPLGLTYQRIFVEAFDARIGSLIRRVHNVRHVPGQLSLLEDAAPESSSPEVKAKPIVELEPERRSEGTIGTGYRVTAAQHRWLHAESTRRGITIQTLITDALHKTGMPRGD
jgi:hypothetical protein